MKFLLAIFMLAAGVLNALGQSLARDLTSPGLWKPERVPFSFKYDGKDSAQLLSSWQISQEAVTENGNQIERYAYTDPITHLKIIAEVRLFPDFPGTVDWVLKFRNDGTSDTPIIEDILPLHWAIPVSNGGWLVRHAQGSDAKAEDFMPLEEHFGPNGTDHFQSQGGRSSSGPALPFFNLQTGDHGLIGAIGWTGNWKADFSYSRDTKTITMASGMLETHLLLHPGEEIRTPRIVLMSWTGGDWQESQNSWRRLLFAHYTPQENGTAMRGPVLTYSWGSEPIADKLTYIQWVHDHKIPVDVYAVDAGWYGDSVGAEMDPTNPWSKNRGDWFPSPRYYPNGIHPLGAALKADGLGFSLWIEPETTMADKKIAKDHPAWFLHRLSSNTKPLLTNLGDPATRQGITDMVSDFITDFGMTWYRQDFNQDPQSFWKLADLPDRIGMTEIGHIEGLYKMWDDLLARHPGLRIDNCASGGRRLDIEMMSRSFAVWRTDYGFTDTLAEQAQTQALAFWVPENMRFETFSNSSPWKKPGPYSTPESLYLMRLGYGAGFGVGTGEGSGIGLGAAGVNNDAWVSWIKQAIAEYRAVQPYFYGDFYPLLPYSRDAEAWTAWQWDRPESKDGLMMILRRPQSPFSFMEVRPRHLNPDATYEVEIRSTYDQAPIQRMKGSELAHLQLQLSSAPSSVLIFYRQR